MTICHENELKAEVLKQALSDTDDAPIPTGIVAEHLKTCASCRELWAATVVFTQTEPHPDAPDITAPEPQTRPAPPVDLPTQRPLPIPDTPLTNHPNTHGIKIALALALLASIAAIIWYTLPQENKARPNPPLPPVATHPDAGQNHKPAGSKPPAKADADSTPTPLPSPNPPPVAPDQNKAPNNAKESAPKESSEFILFWGAPGRPGHNSARQRIAKTLTRLAAQTTPPTTVLEHLNALPPSQQLPKSGKTLQRPTPPPQERHLNSRLRAEWLRKLEHSQQPWFIYVGTTATQQPKGGKASALSKSMPSLFGGSQSEEEAQESQLIDALRAYPRVRLLLTERPQGPWKVFCDQQPDKCSFVGITPTRSYPAEVWFATTVLGLSADAVPKYRPRPSKPTEVGNSAPARKE